MKSAFRLRHAFPWSHRATARSALRWQSTSASAPHIVQSPHPPIQAQEGITISEMMRQIAAGGGWENAVAYDDAVFGVKLTHAQVHRQGQAFGAALLKTKGLRRGDVVGVVLPNCPQYVPVLWGIWEAGLVASPINPSYTEEEMLRQLDDSTAKCVVTIPPFASLFAPGSSESDKSVIVVAEPGSELPAHVHSYAEMIKTDPRGADFLCGSKVNTRETLALLPYSSGTTGLPKGVMISHYNMANHLLQLTTPGVVRFERAKDGGVGAERGLGLLPFFHCFGFTVFCAFAPSVGSHVHCMPFFTPDAYVEALRTVKPTILHVVPPLLAFLVSSPDVTRADLESVHTVVAGAAPIGPTLIKALRDKAGRDLFIQESYGCTELTAGATALPERFNGKTGSCGVPFPSTDMRVVDLETGAAVGPGSVGELCFRGPQMMQGYWRNAEATAEAIRDGWLHTGDLGYYDSDGCIFIVDRLKELIKVKGFQVAPAELENLLRTHPAIADTAVIGVPNAEAGEAPRAYVVIKPDVDAKGVTSEDVTNFVKGKVAKFKELRGGVEFVDAIPKAPSGKILRRELLRVYKETNQ